MDLRFLEQSPDMAPILVRLYESQRLYSLAHDETPLARAELTGAVSELLEMDLAPREQELISDVLIGLMRQAEKDLREALAERLSTIENAPLRVVLHMANDEISVARPVLKSSPVLSDLDLLYIIKGKSAEYWQEIARRANLSALVVNALAETREPETARVLAENRQSHMTEQAANVLFSMSQDDPSLAKPLLARQDIPEDIARRLYALIGGSILQKAAPEIISAVEDVVFELAMPPRQSDFMPTEQMLTAAQVLAKTGRLNVDAIMAPLQRAQLKSFVAVFSVFCGMKAEDMCDILSDSSARRLVVAVRAMNLSKSDFSRIYMMTQRMRSEDRIVDHKELLHASAAFDTISVEKARAALGAIMK